MSIEKNSAKGEIRFNVRIEPDLHARLVDRATANRRSMNSEVVAILSAALNDPSQTNKQALRLEAVKLDQELEAKWEEVTLLRERRRSVSDALAALREQDAKGDA